MPEKLYLVDTNILIRWVQHESSDFDLVNAAMVQLVVSGEVPCYTSQSLGEFWNVLTRPPDRNGYGLTPQDSDIRARHIEASLRFLPDSLSVHTTWRRLLVDYSISGVQVHDARLVASMLVHGVKRIITFNTRDFLRFKEIEAIHSNQFPQDR